MVEGYTVQMFEDAMRPQKHEVVVALGANVKRTNATEDFGMTGVFHDHLALSLKTMHPALAVEAACQAVRAYVASHDFVDLGSEVGDPAYEMVLKRPENKNRG